MITRIASNSGICGAVECLEDKEQLQFMDGDSKFAIVLSPGKAKSFNLHNWQLARNLVVVAELHWNLVN